MIDYDNRELLGVYKLIEEEQGVVLLKRESVLGWL